MDTKVCSHCHRELPLSAFGKRGDYHRGTCRECWKARQRAYDRGRREQKWAKPELPAPKLVDEGEAYEAVLWSIVGQATTDATTNEPYAGEAMEWLEETFGPEHKIVRGVQAARTEGRHISVNLHVQDSMKGAK